jgi:2-polyprenyl-3-methyl-5-hydroxy-6-metoxy-1,4-benzoquinol methylase
MPPVRAVLNALVRWRQMRSLRRFFDRQPLLARSCPLCGETAQRLLLRGDRDAIGIRTAQCAGCGFVFSSPYFPAEVISRFYEDTYRRLFKGQADPRGLAQRQTYLRERAEFYYGFLSRLGLLPGAGGTVLDAGCGEGTLLRTLRANRPDLVLAGVEPTIAFARHLTSETGIPVASDLESLADGQRFDLVTLVHVLEHVHEPVALLRGIAGRLSPDGRLYVDVPDLALHSSIIDLHLAHCNHFSRHTLDAALRRAGLEVVEVVQHRPPTLPPSLYAVARPASAASRVVPPDPEAEVYAARIRAIDPGPSSFWVREIQARLRRAP